MRRGWTIGIMGALAATVMTIAPGAAQAQYYYRAYHGYREGPPPGWRGPPPRADYYGPRYGYRRGYYGRPHRCHGGTGGAIVGAIAGGLLGGAVAGYGDRAAGTIVGGGVGALAGSQLGRGC